MSKVRPENDAFKRAKRIGFLTIAYAFLCALPGILFFHRVPMLRYISGTCVTFLIIVGGFFILKTYRSNDGGGHSRP